MANLQLSIAQLVQSELPAGFVVGDLSNTIKVKQLLLYQQAGIPDDDKFDETKWPDAWNILISYLIVIDILQKAILGGILINAGTDVEGNVGQGQIKKIVTGPAETEWQDTAAAFSTLIKNLTTDPDSVLGLVLSNACALSRVVGIKIPFCAGITITGMFLKAGQNFCFDELITYYCSLNINTCNKPVSMG